MEQFVSAAGPKQSDKVTQFGFLTSELFVVFFFFFFFTKGDPSVATEG